MITFTKCSTKYRKAVSPTKKSKVTIQKFVSKTSKKVVHETDWSGFLIKKQYLSEKIGVVKSTVCN